MNAGRLILVRHGETEWSSAGKHTSFTDIDLTERGREQVSRLAPALAALRDAPAFCSPRRRARATAQLLGLRPQIDEDLQEWNYGAYEGLTTPQIREGEPGWLIWTGHVPRGESLEEVSARTDAVLARVRPLQAEGDVVLIAHGHVLRVLLARYLGLAAAEGRHLVIDTGAYSVAGHEHDYPALVALNCGIGATLTPSPCRGE